MTVDYQANCQEVSLIFPMGAFPGKIEKLSFVDRRFALCVWLGSKAVSIQRTAVMTAREWHTFLPGPWSLCILEDKTKTNKQTDRQVARQSPAPWAGILAQHLTDSAVHSGAWRFVAEDPSGCQTAVASVCEVKELQKALSEE